MPKCMFFAIFASVWLTGCVSENESTQNIGPKTFRANQSESGPLPRSESSSMPQYDHDVSEVLSLHQIEQLSQVTLEEVAQTANASQSYAITKSELEDLVQEGVLSEQDIKELAPILGDVR